MLTDTEPQNFPLPCKGQLIPYEYTLREL